MDDSLPNVEQQISETYVEQKIKIEPEAEQDPLEYVNVTVKSEKVENCEPELDELNPPEYINVPVKSEVFESCEPESINTEDSTHTLFCNELNEKQNVVDSSNYNETEDHCIINKNIDITKPCKDKELSNNPNKGGSSKRRPDSANAINKREALNPHNRHFNTVKMNCRLRVADLTLACYKDSTMGYLNTVRSLLVFE
ncbi:unnamed protein product [Timema podura]|uniref:Uncharacterized protein n=1 Tax=Timema podura TaxID=61482 RepID=A0ABN7NQT0_TIMPD|nr:unnamed protein product [Timema podura]